MPLVTAQRTGTGQERTGQAAPLPATHPGGPSALSTNPVVGVGAKLAGAIGRLLCKPLEAPAACRCAAAMIGPRRRCASACGCWTGEKPNEAGRPGEGSSESQCGQLTARPNIAGALKRRAGSSRMAGQRRCPTLRNLRSPKRAQMHGQGCCRASQRLSLPPRPRGGEEAYS